MRPHTLISVSDVEKSSAWYQTIFGCTTGRWPGAHPENQHVEYDRLLYNGELVLQLHRFDVHHEHGPMGDPGDKPYGNGVLLWFEVDDFDQAISRAAELKADVLMAKHRNPRPNHWECWLRDPDGYTVVIASPDGSAAA